MAVTHAGHPVGPQPTRPGTPEHAAIPGHQSPAPRARLGDPTGYAALFRSQAAGARSPRTGRHVWSASWEPWPAGPPNSSAHPRRNHPLTGTPPGGRSTANGPARTSFPQLAVDPPRFRGGFWPNRAGRPGADEFCHAGRLALGGRLRSGLISWSGHRGRRSFEFELGPALTQPALRWLHSSWGHRTKVWHTQVCDASRRDLARPGPSAGTTDFPGTGSPAVRHTHSRARRVRQWSRRWDAKPP